MFHSLKEHFDRAAFKVVAHEVPEYRHKSFAINVRLPMVLSREFAEFCDGLPSRLAGRIVVEAHKTDIVQHCGPFRGALVLSRCDDPRAFPLARALGIRYVQGRLADQFFKGGMAL